MSVCSIAIAPPYVRGTAERGLRLFHVRSYPETDSTNDDAVALLHTLGPGDAALVKGSRVARLEDVVQRYGEAADA